MSCHIHRNVRLGVYEDGKVRTEDFQGAREGSMSSDQQHQMGIAFSPGRSRHGTNLTQDVDLEAARDDSNFDSREKVDIVGLDKAESKGGTAEKA